VALAIPGTLAAQRNGATLMATATVVAHPATIRALARPDGAAALETTAGAWRLSGRPGAPVGVAFILPDTLVPARAAGGPPVPLAPRRATARWRRPGDGAATRFDAEDGAMALLGGADDPTVQLALAWTPRPRVAAPRGYYLGTLVVTLAYY
jgi:hypothetical protein